MIDLNYAYKYKNNLDFNTVSIGKRLNGVRP